MHVVSNFRDYCINICGPFPKVHFQENMDESGKFEALLIVHNQAGLAGGAMRLSVDEVKWRDIKKLYSIVGGVYIEFNG